MRRASPRILGGLIVLVLASVIALYIAGKNNTAESLIRVVSAIGVLFAVVVALYGDRMRSQLNTLALSVEKPLREDGMFNEKDGKVVFTHHLRVRNLTAYLPVKNCRVWLTRIIDVQPDGTEHESFKFAVGRLMTWAPFEYSPDVRDFSDDQVFDFGLTYVDEGRFRPTFYREQGGTFHPKGDCLAKQTRRYVFEITADNHVGGRQFSVEATVQQIQHSPDWPHAFRTIVRVLT
jgi:hypothetical protein